GREARNEIVRLPADGPGPVTVIASGHDFVSYPRLSPDGERLAFTSWEHPRMPWDGTELWVVEEAGEAGIGAPERVAGGPTESIYQPAWSPSGALHFVSDRSGWWNLYRHESSGDVALAPACAEFGRPQWTFATTTYAFLADGRIACTWIADGRDHLGVIAPGDGAPREVETPFTSFGGPAPLGSGSRVALVAASAREAAAVVVIDVDTGEVEEVRRSQDRPLERAYVSVPEAIEFPTSGDRSGHALFYAPTHPELEGPPGERPPLLVVSHGGPTGAASSAQNIAIQFWTSRGIAVVDVDYGGSTGHGRAYRERLRDQWGIVDTADCIAAARSLVERGRADGGRLAIRGGSAGGFTTLCALTFHDLFRAGASYYGVADLEALARDTHKFESRYLDSLVGPYPAARERYRERSPIHHAERLSCPLLLLQGDEDAIVPPAQAEVMVAALRKRRLPHAYLLFPGEQHGFRRAETIVRALEAELSFYGQILGFEPAGPIEPIQIANLAEAGPGSRF
ncbi:MAG: S9 family peptidase, partial [Myxococcota bacterium]